MSPEETPLRSPETEEFSQAVHQGLGRVPRSLPCRYFYDDAGSDLFELICELPEYYLTRAEDALLREHAGDIVSMLPPDVELVELGCGSARKTRHLIAALLRRQERLRFLAIDISYGMLIETVRKLEREYVRLAVVPIGDPYEEALDRIAAEDRPPRLLLFLGSNLGNFRHDEAVQFLGMVRSRMRAGDHLLLGLDLAKDRATLEAAYDDASGVTARFNRNLLRRINRELEAGFNLAAFRHRAWYNEAEGRVEMHLVSTRDQRVYVEGRRYDFREGESIHTENSYKYTREQLREIPAAAGLRLVRTWLDPDARFSDNLYAVE